MSTTGMGRSTARRMLTGPGLPEPAEQVDGRRLRARGFSDDARALLEHVWALMGMPCGKYLVVMLELWLPLVAAAGDLDKPFATEAAVAELKAMSAATVDRYLKPARERMRIKGISTTKPSPLLRNSITIHTCSDEAPKVPGVIEADTVAHCGPSLIGEFARTLTMTDLVTGWTENASIRNNAAKWILEGIKECQQRFPFPMTVFDSDCGGEFINHDVAGWLQARDIAQTRSRPYQKNDQAHVESKNNHVVRKHAFYWRYDTEPPRHVRRLQFLERMGSCQVVHRGGTRRSCVSGRCGWSQRSAVSTIRSGQRSVRSPVYLVLAARRRCVSGCARRRSMPAHGPGPRPKNPLS
ncbi:hypothetical protein Q625_00546 [Mycobacterium tuberculosis OFXR-8]|nr:hypothetical protein Q626_02912 [Mycobacterium tuberculosis OFXR-9]KBJ56733.1 hypothetical protein Q625_00546 [Mycobacterium tuberculosis OFXR-8]KBJ61869.1 hypothetical protein Q627_01400 [Mycobacterium tuberculosis OFXR-17]KBR99777.1 hypothetical protein X436_02905 [Mycobacterium tuberculosis XTB13-237]KBX68944.1 hypothetical protein I110_00223 [Mycobacterium tuberculosis OFXR-10]KCF78346.1 hypothetical protein P926_02614 [Mycobacterium tuberculosis KT-0022]